MRTVFFKILLHHAGKTPDKRVLNQAKTIVAVNIFITCIAMRMFAVSFYFLKNQQR